MGATATKTAAAMAIAATMATTTTATIMATTSTTATKAKKWNQGLAADPLKTVPYNTADGPLLALLPNPTIQTMGTSVSAQNRDSVQRATTATAPDKRTVKTAQTKTTVGKTAGKTMGKAAGITVPGISPPSSG